MTRNPMRFRGPLVVVVLIGWLVVTALVYAASFDRNIVKMNAHQLVKDADLFPHSRQIYTDRWTSFMHHECVHVAYPSRVFDDNIEAEIFAYSEQAAFERRNLKMGYYGRDSSRPDARSSVEAVYKRRVTEEQTYKFPRINSWPSR